MRYSRAIEIISKLPVSQSVLLLGSPGVGKTRLAEDLGLKMNASVIECRDLCSHLPEDLIGLPFRDGNITKTCPPDWLYSLSEYDRPSRGGVLILDDLGAAPPALQTAAFKLVHERKVGSLKLADNVRVIATSNRREDKSNATTLPAALRNRMLILSIEAHVGDWITWAQKNSLNKEVINFIAARPTALSTLPKDADENGAFATPRSWANLAKCIDLAGEPSLELCKGFVGEGLALEFIQHLKLTSKLPNLRDLINDPENTLPHPPKKADILVALVTGLAKMAITMEMEYQKEIPLKFIKALAHVTQGLNEYASAGISAYTTYGGDPEQLQNVFRSNINNYKVKTMLEHLRTGHKEKNVR